ncbi:unnamed protein product [Effrenium voratum]|nr:unnamed protein product [Effrenium voratum]
MCETASSGLYTCATDCGSAGGPRTCQATDSMASSCFASGINGKTYSTVLSTLTASSTEDCQQRCRRTGGCAHFSYYPTSTASNCKLHDFTATESTESGTTSGPPTCLASVSIVNNVNANQIGFFRLYYLCTDSLGVQSGFSRVVEVGCEGPNPGGVYGGNTITCEKVQSGPAVMADYLACVKECTGDSVCEAYEFMGFSGGQGNCTTWSGCDGKYGTDLETMRQVGYCQRINHYPKIFVTPSDRTVNVGNAYAEGAVACTDYEDPYPPVPTTVTSFDVNVPGQYMFYYTCKDQIGQETLGNRTVTVKANCSSPSGVANAADPPCQEGLATFAHGGTCTTVCLTGYTQSRTSVTCTTNSDADFASDWDNTFVCGDSPCDAPLNVKNLKEATGSETIYSCSEGSQVVSGASCTPNCKEGDDPKYVPTVASLACSKEVLTPSTYECHSVAYMPQYVQYKERDVDKIVVKWAIGSPSDCVFANWRLEYILITSSSGQSAWSDWLENPNCPISALGGTARTDVLECTANTLEEGSTYKFRVRQECTNTDLNSDWQTSEEIATTILTPPVTIFTLPNADVYGSPGSVMVAFDQAVQPGYADRKVELIKFGENCQPSADGTYNFTKYAPEMKTTSLEGASGMEIAGSRILIVTPFAEYFTGSCTYNVSFEAASILPDTTGTIKELVAFWYNFTYIEVPPSLTYITRNDSATSTTAIGYNILWTKRTQMNCTASPKDASSCQAKASTAALSPTIARRCESRNSTNDMIQELDTPLSFTIDDLYPGVQYFVVCAGWIPGQFWVPTVDIDASQEIHQTVTTDQDTEVGISSFRLTVFAVCEDGSEGQVYQAYLRTSEFDLGYTTQIDHWLGACRVGGTLALEESVNFRWLGEVVTVSANAYVQWDAGPSLVVTYTKPADATESAIVTNHLKFTILSLAWWEENRDTYKQAHQVQLQIVDIGFSYPAPAGFSKAYSIQSGGSGLAPLYQSSGEALPSGYEELVLDVGALLHFNIKVSQSSFDWGDVSLHLKSVTVGFPVPMVKVSENGQEALWALNFTGQGTQRQGEGRGEV